MREVLCDRCGARIRSLVEVKSEGSQNALLDLGFSYVRPVWAPGDHVIRFLRLDLCGDCVRKEGLKNSKRI